MLPDACSKFWRLPRYDKALLMEALAALLAARLALLLFPFRRIARWLGREGIVDATGLTAAQEETARRIAWAINALATRLPWDGRCLVRAIAAEGMAVRRGLPATLYLGVRSDATQEFSAHAWLRCGEQIVTGEAGHETFRVIACFSHFDSVGSRGKGA